MGHTSIAKGDTGIVGLERMEDDWCMIEYNCSLLWPDFLINVTTLTFTTGCSATMG